MKNIEIARDVFLESSAKQAEATENGDYKTANKYYDKIIKSANFIKNENEINIFYDYLSNPNVGVRLWSAYFLLPVNEREALKVLKDIVKTNEIHSLTAETTVKEWKKGNLKF
ncbi:DUF2019 domain-containing protein [Flavobacterium hibisci]|uniref:DUF2019 domain-containing protein n=1 Tax=Flavobacterium hibisci TaxID=1914462 RepID=UPI0004264B62|nr:DUF2019 domain-containing protein [Flavobacterium hibisci]MBZ4043676.1 DUF2019 domain-containing protein [Flavobacterium hibisci]